MCQRFDSDDSVGAFVPAVTLSTALNLTGIFMFGGEIFKLDHSEAPINIGSAVQAEPTEMVRQQWKFLRECFSVFPPPERNCEKKLSWMRPQKSSQLAAFQLIPASSSAFNVNHRPVSFIPDALLFPHRSHPSREFPQRKWNGGAAP